MTEGKDDRTGRQAQFAESDPLHLVREALAQIRFGGIQLTVHQGKLVQMEVTEKHRFV
ncbi:Uncharacterized small protein [Novosphingobium mathurense]|uniref:Uncharacterized small protein n=2 Tax=Novosphingobium mathurense TaxID=428990 RepID=A0A1U6HTX1_9SPHN|nr:Uncharacterized small protein [Novosphingobium mathurense]